MNKKHYFLIFFSVVCVLGLALPGHSMYLGNWLEKSFTDPTGRSITITQTDSIKNLIIKAGTSFFKGHANINVLVSKLEIAEIDGVSYYELQTILTEALANMRNSRNYYSTLINTTASLEYNPDVLNQLKNFDYLSLSSAYGLNMDIFNQVKNYLYIGDVRGTYTKLFTYTDTIVKLLESIQQEIYASTGSVDTAKIWRLNQECSQMILFGQYIAQVFKHIRV